MTPEKVCTCLGINGPPNARWGGSAHNRPNVYKLGTERLNGRCFGSVSRIFNTAQCNKGQNYSVLFILEISFQGMNDFQVVGRDKECRKISHLLHVIQTSDCHFTLYKVSTKIRKCGPRLLGIETWRHFLTLTHRSGFSREMALDSMAFTDACCFFDLPGIREKVLFHFLSQLKMKRSTLQTDFTDIIKLLIMRCLNRILIKSA